MSLGSRIALALLVPMLLLVGLAAYQMSVIDRLVAQNREIGLLHRRLETDAVELREDLARLAEFGEKMRATGDPAYADAVDRSRADVESGIEEIQALALGGSEREAALRALEAWREVDDAPGLPDPVGVERLDVSVGELIETSRENSARVIADGAEQAARARGISGFTAVLCVGGAALLALLLVQMVSRPVRRVARATRGVADGDFTQRARPSGPPELAALARDFNVMAERLGEIDRLKETLLTNVSHDLKAPLASMHETNALVLDEIPGPLTERQRDLLRHNQDSNRRLSRMVHDLLDLTRLQGKAMAYDFRRLDLVRMSRAAAVDLESGADGEGVTLEVRAPGGEVWTEGDESSIRRVIDNLLTNAIRYSPPGERVAIEVSANGEGRVRLAVCDRGPGIPDEHKERIFERFYRVAPAAGVAGQGTGIGLAIAASITTDHNGTLHVEDRPGGGSRFVLDLPAAAARPEPAPARA